ncbi:unnamed protein product [Brachionus calyciflorus]|uniref:CCHC-type domain-containing protein n=1 Tax=Brachionus calyciflorus TaxID=104777 RepID=A0A813V1M4_9BILA|nr:unnamed protein product [Brachionus calyciflorus]
MLSDKSWKDLVTLFEKSVDFKSITTKVEDESILVNKLNAMSLKTPTKFSGECFYCHKPGHRKSDCRKRLSDEKYGGNGNQRRYNNDRRNMRVSLNNVDRTPNSRQNYESRRYARRTDERVKSKQAFVIDAEIDDDESDYEVNSIEYSIECNGLRVNGLYRVNLVVKLGDSLTNVQMLVDSGSSGSFIHPTKLPANLKEKIETFLKDANDPNDYDLKKSTINIKAALSAKRVYCAIGDLIVSSNGRFGKHQFIFADVAEEGILGLNFLKKFNAVIDYANDRITIKDGEKDIFLNYLSNNSISDTCGVKCDDDTGLTDITEHDIDPGNTRPIKQRPYRLPQSSQEEVSKQVDDILKKT